jgi:hypothetical protein
VQGHDAGGVYHPRRATGPGGLFRAIVPATTVEAPGPRTARSRRGG